jgi:hypothetical protein
MTVPTLAIAPNVAHDVWPWAWLLVLGALHGINPGMGWLFAVALGLQRRTRRAVWLALLPLAAGHAAAIAVVAAAVSLAGLALPLGVLRWVVAVTLLCVGVWKLASTRHPRFGGMTVGSRQVAVWSFLMASAHGAGLMIVPFLLRVSRPAGAAADHLHAHGAASGGVVAGGIHAEHVASLAGVLPNESIAGVGVALVHTAGYLVMTGLIAVIVYERLGLRLLGRAWLNVDRVWAAALIATASLTPFIA